LGSNRNVRVKAFYLSLKYLLAKESAGKRGICKVAGEIVRFDVYDDLPEEMGRACDV
jgi:hypothetical protein